MANQQFIIQHESKLIEAKTALDELSSAAELETGQGGNRQNYDCWGTTLLNAETLLTKLQAVIPKLQAVKDAAAR